MTKIKPYRPKDAATLVLYRQNSGDIEVLMGCRHSKHAFMPNRYVFPGGAVDNTDRFVKPASVLGEPSVCQPASSAPSSTKN